MKRDEMLAAMEDRDTVWDIIIIGGGATGLGAAVEAASRGHRTVLVESDDFAKGTSSRSTKLIHGGVRYLRQGQLSMVRQSLRERELLLRNAPHLVHMLDFVLPTYRRGSREFYYAGLRFYDMLAGHVLSGHTRRLTKQQTCEQLPTLRDDQLRGGVMYADGQFDDTRLAIALARTAAEQGAILANAMRVERLIHLGTAVTGVAVRDRETNREIVLQGKVVLNATGVFASDVLQMDETSARPSNREAPVIVPSQGSHLVLDQSFLPGSAALMIPETDDGRVLFAIPWHGKILLGTTDVAVSKVSREPRPLDSEVQYLLEHAGRYLNRQPQRSDILSHFAGLRPLVGAKLGTRATSKLSREHEIYTSDSGLITVIGGKWTTYRKMGEDLIDHAERSAGLRRRPSRTAELPLHGCPTTARIPKASNHEDFHGTHRSQMEDLIRNQPELSQPLHPKLPYQAVDVVWAARYEMARTVEDILARRTRALLLDARASIESAPVVAGLLAQELGRDEQWKREQITSFCQLATETYLAGSVINATDRVDQT